MSKLRLFWFLDPPPDEPALLQSATLNSLGRARSPRLASATGLCAARDPGNEFPWGGGEPRRRGGPGSRPCQQRPQPAAPRGRRRARARGPFSPLPNGRAEGSRGRPAATPERPGGGGPEAGGPRDGGGQPHGRGSETDWGAGARPGAGVRGAGGRSGVRRRPPGPGPTAAEAPAPRGRPPPAPPAARPRPPRSPRAAAARRARRTRRRRRRRRRRSLCLGTSLPSPLRAQPERSEDPGGRGGAGPARAARRAPAPRAADATPRPALPTPPRAVRCPRPAAARLRPGPGPGAWSVCGFPVRRCRGHLRP